MARKQNFGLPDIARVGVNIEAAFLLVYPLLLDGVTMVFEAAGEPLACFLFVICDGLNLRQVLVEGKDVMFA